MRRISGALAALVAAAACSGARSPATAPEKRAGEGARAGACGGCHPAIVAEHDASFHAAAFTDETFQTSLALEEPEEHAFCTRCHAPAAAAGRGGPSAGVDCASCHGAAPHVRGGSRGHAECASCHEFAFDDGRPDLVQKTVSEHAASAFAGTACAACHMPPRGDHTDHRFVSGHDPARIARAVHVDVARPATPERASIDVAIRVDAGHAFPTGDMFRRARLVLFAEDEDGHIVADAARTFGRSWTSVRAGEHAGRRAEAGDTRIHGAWREVVVLDAPSAPIARVRWSLLYERVINVRGSHERLASRDTIAEGVLDFHAP